ncbi:MAG: hypothetical protein H6716_26420 [Polyangiaceae bacterium]|nr:hypothetical protein [Polyangiaceae bacterium]
MRFKLKFLLFNDFALKVSIERGVDERYRVRGLFPTPLNYPYDFHGSIFTIDAELGIHVTWELGKGRRKRKQRRQLTKFTSERLEQYAAKRCADELWRFLEPVSPEEWHQEGWVGHGMNPRAVLRWMERACVPGGTIRVDSDTLHGIVYHLMKHPVALPRLREIQGFECLPVVNWERPDLDARVIGHYPTGLELPGGKRFPPGWYWIRHDGLADAMLPTQELERAMSRLDAILESFGVPPSEISKFESCWPPQGAILLGVYLPVLFELAISIAVARHEHALLLAADGSPLST